MNIIYTVTDSNYLPLTMGLVSSISNYEFAIDKIIIGALGLSPAEKTKLEKLDSRVSFIDLAEVTYSKRLHDDGWIQRTAQKTYGLLSLLEAGNRVFMLDSDCLVMQQFVVDLRHVGSIGVCRRHNPALRKDMKLDYIASFFVGEGELACGFVRLWIELQQKLIVSSYAPPYETPALCKAIRLWDPSTITELDENVYSKQNKFETKPRIIHLKSNSTEDLSDILSCRLSALGEFDRKIAGSMY